MPVYMPKYENENGRMTPAGTEVLFEGAVLADREKNGYDDSDFYVVAWDGEKLVNYEYNTTRYAGGGSALVDATPEVKEKAENWVYRNYRKAVFREYVDSLKVPEKGDRVVVARGRKVPVGTTGTLFWIGEPRVYGGYSKWSQTTVQKVGVALDDERDEKGRYKNVVWTYLKNLDVAPEQVRAKFSFEKAKRYLKGLRRNWMGTWLVGTSPYMVV